jgi:uncharacterized membrane protein
MTTYQYAAIYPTLFPASFFCIIAFWLAAIIYTFFYKKITTKTNPFQKLTTKKENIIVYTLLALSLSFYFWLNYSAFNTLNLFDRDLIGELQILWKVSQGINPHNTIFSIHMLADHWTLIYYPIALTYKFIPQPLFVLFLTILSYLGGALIIFKIAKLKLKSSLLSIAILLSVLLNPYIYLGLLARANTDVFSFFFISLSFYYLFKNKSIHFIFLALIAMSCKEDVALYFIPVGIWCYFSLKKSKTGIIITLSSLIYFLLITKIAMPFFGSDNNLFNFQDMYPTLGSTTNEIIRSFIKNPHTILIKLFCAQSISSLTFLLAPFLVFFFCAGSTLYLCLTPFTVKLLASYTATFKFTKHAIWHPLFFIYLAVIFGIRNCRFLIIKKFKIPKRQANIYIAFILIIATVLNLSFWKKFTFYTYRSYRPISSYLSTTRTPIKKAAINSIPKIASLLADAEFLTYSPNRTNMFEINNFNKKPILEILESVEYAIFDFKKPYQDALLIKMKPKLQKYLNTTNHWQNIYSFDNIEVYKNKSLTK